MWRFFKRALENNGEDSGPGFTSYRRVVPIGDFFEVNMEYIDHSGQVHPVYFIVPKISKEVIKNKILKELQEAIDNEDFEKAAQLRDELKNNE